MKRQLVGGRYKFVENVEYVVRDAQGNIKKIFNHNRLGSYFVRIIRLFVKNPIANDGQIKPGIFNRMAIYGINIPFFMGSWEDKRVIHNLITSAGKAGAASRINGAGGEAAFIYIAMGTGTTPAAAGDTTLETELASAGLSRVSATASRVTTSVTNDTAQLSTVFSVSGTVTVTESGVLNASSGGTLLCRQTFTGIPLVNGDTLTVTWKIQAAS